MDYAFPLLVHLFHPLATMETFATALREAAVEERIKSGASTTATMLNRALLSHPEQIKQLNSVLRKNGTDTTVNEMDPFGDGDQTPIIARKNRDAVRRLWATGADVDTAFTPHVGNLTKFGSACVLGVVGVVKQLISQAAKESPEAVRALVERRETVLRLPPLMLVLTGQPRFNMVGTTKDTTVVVQRYVDIVAQLLMHGAQPRARCVVGKTVVHYGAGMLANATTLAITDMCIAASKAGPPPWTEVILTGLTKAELNGRRGIVRGYVHESGRRSVELHGAGSKTLAIKPINIAAAADADAAGTSADGTADGAAAGATPLLVDTADRLGSVQIHDAVDQNLPHLVKFLAGKHGASVTLQSPDGRSAVSRATTNAFSAPDASAELNRIMLKRARHSTKAQKRTDSHCCHCGATPARGAKLNLCSGCEMAQYCGKACQRNAWKGHKADCKTAAEQLGILLQPVALPEGMSLTNPHTGKGRTQNAWGVGRPAYAAVDELFYVKVQTATPLLPGESHPPLAHVAYDETRQCMFEIPPGSPGYTELNDIIVRKGAMGRKAHFKVKFDQQGRCYIFPKLMALKKW